MRRAMSAVSFCSCDGAEHLVCRDWRVSTAVNTLAQFATPLSDPPPLAKVWRCGPERCTHLVCDPFWTEMRDGARDIKPIRPLTLKQALAAGLTLRPHTTHVLACLPACDRSESHKHQCACGFEKNGFAPRVLNPGPARPIIRVCPVMEDN